MLSLITINKWWDSLGNEYIIICSKIDETYFWLYFLIITGIIVVISIIGCGISHLIEKKREKSRMEKYGVLEDYDDSMLEEDYHEDEEEAEGRDPDDSKINASEKKPKLIEK